MVHKLILGAALSLAVIACVPWIRRPPVPVRVVGRSTLGSEIAPFEPGDEYVYWPN